MVFQSAMNSLNPVMTIGDQIVDIFTTHEGDTKKQARARAADLLDLVANRCEQAQGLPAPALRRHAPTCRHRDGGRSPSHAADHGRAHHRARRGRAAGDHGADRRPATRARLLDPVHHPRHVVDDRAVPPDGCHVCRAVRRDRRRQGALRQSATPLHPCAHQRLPAAARPGHTAGRPWRRGSFHQTSPTWSRSHPVTWWHPSQSAPTTSWETAHDRTTICHQPAPRRPPDRSRDQPARADQGLQRRWALLAAHLPGRSTPSISMSSEARSWPW